MPSYLDFNTTSTFRDFLIGRTLQQPNGPQTYNDTNYPVQNLSNFPNSDLGDVENDRAFELLQTQTLNTYKPLTYFIKDTIDTLPRRANLSLYPYFTPVKHNLIGIMSTGNYDTESELFKFAASYIRDKDQKGPVYARLAQNIYAATAGRARLLDALNGNTSTAINLLTGREPLIDPNYQITTAKTLPGQAVDFIKTITGIEIPVSTIPGDYLSNPSNPINYRPKASTETGKFLQDATGVLGSLLGIQRRPKLERKPSDLLIEYTSDGQNKTLFNMLSYSKYAPNYTTTARSQNSSKVFNFIDNVAQDVKNLLGVEAPAGTAYIGDDRGNDVKYSMNDFNDRPVRSNFYLSLMFDESSARLFQRNKNIGEGGSLSGNVTWISKNSKNPKNKTEVIVGKSTGNGEMTTSYKRLQPDDLVKQSESTNFTFREDSILGVTQEILDSMPSNGGEARSHVANSIDQTSRLFKDGDIKMSRGSAIKYVNKFTGEESGAEYCRVWTKDYAYYSMGDTMKRTGNIRKYDGSVMSTPWNLNIGPMSNGNYDPSGKDSFEDSTNIFKNGDGFYAKKYMFSIENLAWKNSSKEGFRVVDLPFCERGPNGGRVMWFPPYDLKVSESSSAKWSENSFLGRPEPIFTYENTTRSGNVSFKVIVDHPSILNLLVRDYFKNMSDEESDNYINAFFAGCEEADLYDLIKKYTTLTQDDITLIQNYLNNGVSSTLIDEVRTNLEDVTTVTPESSSQSQNNNEVLNVVLRFQNDVPKKIGTKEYITNSTYTNAFEEFKPLYAGTKTDLGNDSNILLGKYSVNTTSPLPEILHDNNLLFGTEKPNIVSTPIVDIVNNVKKLLQDTFDKLDSDFETYKKQLEKLKTDISLGNLGEVVINIGSSTSILNSKEDNPTVKAENYNINLSYRRSYSVLIDILNRITKDGKGNPSLLKWDFKTNQIIDTKKIMDITIPDITFKDLGYNTEGKVIFKVKNYGENGTAEEGSTKFCNAGKFRTKLGVPKIQSLDVVAPISLKCRQTSVGFTYKPSDKQPTTTNTNTTTQITKINKITRPIETKNKKPAIDVMKRIIMKTLSECFYFKRLEQTSPIAFSSLREKLKYFHPAFHSMTPEGLNARLTFIQQCLRPGDTMPIKGISDVMDMNARNTTFGPPPICVIRIGDFYHSKIIIENVNIALEETTWDLNPEGIGVQPMIANVTLQVKFIGGQGLEKPVERLQNALSSNFYANTEMYDERSIITNTKIDGKTTKEFTDLFLKEELQRSKTQTPQRSNDVNNNETITQNTYMGVYTKDKDSTTGGTIGFETIVSDLYKDTKSYFDTYMGNFKSIYDSYGADINSLIFSSDYRKIYQYDVFKTAGGSATSIELLGNYKKGKELNIYLDGVKIKLIENLLLNGSISKDLLDIKMNSSLFNKSDGYLKTFFTQEISNTIDGIMTKTSSIEGNRDKLISTLDKMNFIVYYEHDAQTSGTTYTYATLSGFTSNKLYDKCSESVDYIEKNHSKLTSKIDSDIDFNSISSITLEQSNRIISILLYPQKQKILDLYKQDTSLFKGPEINAITKALDNFLVKPDSSKINFKLKKDSNYNAYTETYKISLTSDITDEVEKTKVHNIFSNNVPVIDKLNYYKKPK